MLSLLDEFEDLLQEDTQEDLVKASKNYIRQYEEFTQNNMQTYSGVYKDSILECVDVVKSDVMPWEHVRITLDVSKLRDISKPRLSHFTIPHFVEEVCSIGDANSSGFGYNEYGRNHVQNIVIPASIYTIDRCSFSFYRKLESMSMPEDSRLSIIGDDAFTFCENLVEVDLSKCGKLVELPKKLFRGSPIKKLKLNSYLRSVDETTFDDCKLKTVYIDDQKYVFDSFIGKLSANNYKAFWV